MKVYQIFKDGQLFAGMTEGDPSRFGKPFDDSIFEQEFRECKWFWMDRGIDPSRFSKKIIEKDNNTSNKSLKPTLGGAV